MLDCSAKVIRAKMQGRPCRGRWPQLLRGDARAGPTEAAAQGAGLRGRGGGGGGGRAAGARGTPNF